MKALLLSAKDVGSAAPSAVADVLRARGFRVYTGERASGDRWDVVVTWEGSTAVQSHAALVLNPPGAVRLAQSPTDAGALLYAHGIPVAPRHLPPQAVRPVQPPPQGELLSVRVHVGDLRVLAVEGDVSSDSVSRWRFQRMMEGACRSVYVLGLHFGCVHLEVHPRGRWYVSHVDPAPRLAPDLAQAYGAAIAELCALWCTRSEHLPDAVLGADPEFALLSQEGKLLYASRYVRHSGTVGYDRQSRASRGAVFPLVEIRPNPSPSPRVLFGNVARALAAAKSVLPARRTVWAAGSYPFAKYPTGGHIHFSGLPLSTPVLQALDNYLAIPAMLLEERVRARKRRRKYGGLGEFRRKEHGGFEYRTPASWLVSPEATSAVVCLAKVVSTHWYELAGRHFETPRVAKEFYLAKKGRFRTLFPHLWDRIMKTETAAEYRYELSYFADAIAKGAEWSDDSDFKRSWGL